MRTAALLFFLAAALALGAEPIRPKVVVIATYEIGADTGDRPGEFQFWVERERLDGTLAVPGLDHPVRFNADGLYGVVSGTTSRAGQQLMALVLDPRFDFSRTYWVVAGIAGVNPRVATVGSAAWARHVIDGDIAYEIDSREAPADWPYGIMALGNRTPLKQPVIPAWAPKPMAWTLNPALVDWAYGLTRDLDLPDSPEAQAHRAQFLGFPAALARPRVLLGDSFGCSRYWHGAVMQRWADDWTRFYAGPDAVCAMTDMEDQGIAAALSRLGGMGRLDFQRVLFLRAGSNFSQPPEGQAASASLVSEYAGRLPALESAHCVGSTVVHVLLRDWERFATQAPGQK